MYLADEALRPRSAYRPVAMDQLLTLADTLACLTWLLFFAFSSIETDRVSLPEPELAAEIHRQAEQLRKPARNRHPED